jgi:hypothetical protein
MDMNGNGTRSKTKEKSIACPISLKDPNERTDLWETISVELCCCPGTDSIRARPPKKLLQPAEWFLKMEQSLQPVDTMMPMGKEFL